MSKNTRPADFVPFLSITSVADPLFKPKWYIDLGVHLSLLTRRLTTLATVATIPLVVLNLYRTRCQADAIGHTLLSLALSPTSILSRKKRAGLLLFFAFTPLSATVFRVAPCRPSWSRGASHLFRLSRSLFKLLSSSKVHIHSQLHKSQTEANCRAASHFDSRLWADCIILMLRDWSFSRPPCVSPPV